MKQNIILAVAVASLLSTTGVQAAAANSSLNTQMDKVSYAIGYDIGKGFNTQQLGVETNPFEAGFEAGLQGTTPTMTAAEMQATLVSFQKQMQQKAMQSQQSAAASNLKNSQAYLAKIAKQAGVVQLQPGLYYKVMTAGKGQIPSANDTVTVNYEGSLPNGKVFDSSYQRGQPATFEVGQVIPGWTAALQKMPVGSTWMVYIAPDLAYGAYAPPQIGPNQALTFKIELISATASGSNS